MFNVTDSDQLFKVHQFRIERNSEVIWVDVYEHLNSTSDIKYHAMPIEKALGLNRPKAEYIAKGSTLELALNSCLSSIQGISRSSLFEKKA